MNTIPNIEQEIITHLKQFVSFRTVEGNNEEKQEWYMTVTPTKLVIDGWMACNAKKYRKIS